MESASLPNVQPRVDLKVWLGRGIILIALGLTWLICVIVFRVLNRTTIYGREYARPRRRCLIVSNHQSLIDSFLVGWIVNFPSVMWHPDLAPAHLADAKNFTAHPVLKYIYDVLRVIPVGRDPNGKRSDQAAFKAARKALRDGRAIHVFAEGTRARDENLLPPVPQVGAFALVEGVTVQPVYISGMHAVQSYYKGPDDLPSTLLNRLFGKRWRHTVWLLGFTCGNTITVALGPPISPEQLRAVAGEGRPREQYARVAEYIMGGIKNLQDAVQAQSSGTR